MYVCMYVDTYNMNLSTYVDTKRPMLGGGAGAYVCMYVCMYVWMDVCMYVDMYVSMYVCMYACM